MSEPRILGAARTPFGALGGGSRDASTISLAASAATLAIERAGSSDGIDAVVAAVGLPTTATDLGLAAAIAERLDRSTATSATLIGLDASGSALQLARDLATRGTRTLVVGVDSASRAAYWLGDLRLGAGEGSSSAVDPLGAALDPLQRDGSPPHLLELEAERRGLGRAALDHFSAGSHRSAASRLDSGGRSLASDAGDRDELALEDPSAALTASPSLHTRGGDLTVANCAAPLDGAVALLLGPGQEGAILGETIHRAAHEPGSCSAAAAAAATLLEVEGIDPGSLARVMLGECSAAQALIAIEQLGLDRELVNPLGGSIALGRPGGGATLLLAAEAADGAPAGPVLLADESPTGTGLAALITVGEPPG